MQIHIQLVYNVEWLPVVEWMKYNRIPGVRFKVWLDVGVSQTPVDPFHQSPTTAPNASPPYATQTHKPSLLAIVVYSQLTRTCLLLLRKRRKKGQATESKRQQEQQQQLEGRRKSVITIITTRAPSLRYTPTDPRKPQSTHNGPYQRAPTETAPLIQCLEFLLLIHISRTRSRRR